MDLTTALIALATLATAVSWLMRRLRAESARIDMLIEEFESERAEARK